jgi:isoleucyl-tRNA synthetase
VRRLSEATGDLLDHDEQPLYLTMEAHARAQSFEALARMFEQGSVCDLKPLYVFCLPREAVST